MLIHVKDDAKLLLVEPLEFGELAKVGRSLVLNINDAFIYIMEIYYFLKNKRGAVSTNKHLVKQGVTVNSQLVWRSSSVIQL